jgi:hypothetical protein
MDALDLKSLSLMKITLPSISVTMETKYQYAVYIAIDEDDYLVNAQDIIAQRFCCASMFLVVAGISIAILVLFLTLLIQFGPDG